jgi:hypothetical protein
MREDLYTRISIASRENIQYDPKRGGDIFFSLFDALRDIRPPYRITFRRYKAVRSAC